MKHARFVASALAVIALTDLYLNDLLNEIEQREQQYHEKWL